MGDKEGKSQTSTRHWFSPMEEVTTASGGCYRIALNYGIMDLLWRGVSMRCGVVQSGVWVSIVYSYAILGCDQ